jgi:hypothetical protein
MLTELSEAQKAALPVVRDEWIAHGLSCERANRPLAEEGVRDAYQAAGLEPPELVIWMDSPLAGVVAAAYLTQLSAAMDKYLTPKHVAEVTAQIAQENAAKAEAEAGAARPKRATKAAKTTVAEKVVRKIVK